MTIRQHQTAAPVEPIADLHPAVFALGSTLLGVSGTCYAQAMTITAYPRSVVRALFNVATAGAGTIVGEIAIGTSPASVLLNVAASVVITPQVVQSLSAVTLTATGLKNVPIGAGYTVPAGAQAWILIRTALTTTQPTYGVFSGVPGLAACRSLAASGVLAVGTGISFTIASSNVPAVMIGSV